jgi:transcription termination factor Rho
MICVPELFAKPRPELLALAAEHGVDLRPHLTHAELVAELVTQRLAAGDDVVTEGELSMLHEGFGFVRLAATDYGETAVDAYVSPSQIRSLHLQQGHRVKGRLRAPRGNERFLALTRVESVQGVDADALGDVVPFGARTAIVPDRALPLGDDGPWAGLAQQAPWRFGHRVLVHKQQDEPTAAWLTALAGAIAAAHPSVDVTLCLLDQRPEDLAVARALAADAHANLTTVGTTFASPPRRHADVADLALHAALRRVEHGHDVVLLLDSVTALTHAHARSQAPSGAWIQPGLDARAVLAAKQLFAAARQTAEAGSLTVLATVLEHGSAIDGAIADEFAPTSNSDVWPGTPERSRTRPEGRA